jgi:hypothetical protein
VRSCPRRPPLPVDTITGINLATLGTDFIRGAPAYLMQAVRECLGELNLSNFRRPLRSYPIRAPTSYSVCCAASAAREVTPRRLTLASGPGMGDHQPYFTHGRLSKSLRLAGKYAVGNLSTHVWVSWVRGASRSQLAWTISTPCAERKRGLCNEERFTRYLVEVCEGRLTNHTTRRRCPATKLLLTLRPTHHHLRQTPEPVRLNLRTRCAITLPSAAGQDQRWVQRRDARFTHDQQVPWVDF